MPESGTGITDGLTAVQRAHRQEYLDQSRVGAAHHATRVVAGPAGDLSITDRLIDLYLAGTKYVGSGLVAEYECEGDPLPQVGDHWIALGAEGEPRCILRTTRVETHVFRDVSAAIALAEGEGDLSVDHWRRGHAEFNAPYLAEWGITDIEDAIVVTEFFELVYPSR